MKHLTRTCALMTLGCLLPMGLHAQTTETKETTSVTESADGSVTETKTTVTTFNPEVRTKVVEYFETYKANPHGLPPEWVTRFQVEQIPAAWRTTRIAPGVVVTEKQRPLLVEAPAELIKVLPAPAPEVRYYVAGSNIVAVNKTYEVVDSFQVPTVKLKVKVDDDDDDDDD